MFAQLRPELELELMLELMLELELVLVLVLVRRCWCFSVDRVGFDQFACLAVGRLIVECFPGCLRAALLVPGPVQPVELV